MLWLLFRPFSVLAIPSSARLFRTTAYILSKPLQLPPRPTVSEDDIEEAFLKGSGPGGQKINKTSSAVQLKHLPTGLVVKCQATRSRSQNRKYARTLLAEKLEVMEKGEESRVMVKGGVKKKKKASSGKKARRKYRALAEGMEGNEDVAEEEQSSRISVVEAIGKSAEVNQEKGE